MSEWRPSVDPLGLLEQHVEVIKMHDESLVNIAHAVNANAATIENLVRHIQQMHSDIYLLRQEVERLKASK